MQNKLKNKKYNLIIITVFLLSLFVFPQADNNNAIAADDFSNRLKGKILLQANRNGEAWYVNPDNQKRYYLGRPMDAFNIMKELGLGISEDSYNSILKNNNLAPDRLKGKILLRVKANGEAYYVNPDNKKIHYLGRPKDAFNIMRDFGLGISDEDLNNIKIYAKHKGYPIGKNENITKNLNIECPTHGEGRCEGNKVITCQQLDGSNGYELGEIQCAENQECREEERNFFNRANCFTIIPCHEPNYTMAFILLEKADDKATDREIEYLNEIKQAFAERFSWASRGMATMDTAYPIVKMEMKPYPTDPEVIKRFYETNVDEFDFITVYHTYDANKTMSHADIQNNILGIGTSVYNNNDSYNNEFEDNRRLLGVNWMKDIGHSLPEFNICGNMHDQPEEIEGNTICAVNGVLHETAHQWGANLDYIDENGEKQWDLRYAENNVHWNALNLGYGAIGGVIWTDNKDGTFTMKEIATNEDRKKMFTDIDLYVMGLLPKEKIKPIELIVTDEERYPGWTVSGYKKIITIDQIIAAEGERKCAQYYYPFR